jgi:hypothetical protein
MQKYIYIGCNLFLSCWNVYLAALPAVRYTSLAGRHSYYGCGGLVPRRLLAIVAVCLPAACRAASIGGRVSAISKNVHECNNSDTMMYVYGFIASLISCLLYIHTHLGYYPKREHPKKFVKSCMRIMLVYYLNKAFNRSNSSRVISIFPPPIPKFTYP